MKNRRSDDPEVLRITMELNLLKKRREITKLGQRYGEGASEIPLSELPELSAVYANLLGDIENNRLLGQLGRFSGPGPGIFPPVAGVDNNRGIADRFAESPPDARLRLRLGRLGRRTRLIGLGEGIDHFS